MDDYTTRTRQSRASSGSRAAEARVLLMCGCVYSGVAFTRTLQQATYAQPQPQPQSSMDALADAPTGDYETVEPSAVSQIVHAVSDLGRSVRRACEAPVRDLRDGNVEHPRMAAERLLRALRRLVQSAEHPDLLGGPDSTTRCARVLRAVTRGVYAERAASRGCTLRPRFTPEAAHRVLGRAYEAWGPGEVLRPHVYGLVGSLPAYVVLAYGAAAAQTVARVSGYTRTDGSPDYLSWGSVRAQTAEEIGRTVEQALGPSLGRVAGPFAQAVWANDPGGASDLARLAAWVETFYTSLHAAEGGLGGLDDVDGVDDGVTAPDRGSVLRRIVCLSASPSSDRPPGLLWSFDPVGEA